MQRRNDAVTDYCVAHLPPQIRRGQRQLNQMHLMQKPNDAPMSDTLMNDALVQRRTNPIQ
jgi:hypothetical protein